MISIFKIKFLILVTASKPKKPESNTAGKDSDSRASTPSKEVTPGDKSLTNSNGSSTSRGRIPKQSSAVFALGTPNLDQNTTRELKRGAVERDSRDEGPKYVSRVKIFNSINWIQTI